MDQEQRKLLLASIDNGKTNLKLNQKLVDLIEHKIGSKEEVNYNWFALSRLLHA
ncbi:hypothetical protein JCM19232_3743 [Vibrio ishigakensis]|uniref:Uncharacterized protein n=1 Tax=Vibrio ishigakensis TaxID=1481914 RepID=A0A0B8P3K3_9VIBR|nr:hypothetical protein JCM19232_3743 [Vibrio ishigakensis]